MEYDIAGMVIWALIFVLVWKLVDFAIHKYSSRNNFKSRHNWWIIILVVVGIYLIYSSYFQCDVKLYGTITGDVCVEKHKGLLSKYDSNFFKQRFGDFFASGTVAQSTTTSVCEEIVPEEVYIGEPLGRKVEWKNDWTPDVYPGFRIESISIPQLHRFRKGQYSGENVNWYYTTEPLDAVKKMVNLDEKGNIKSVNWYWYKVSLVLEGTPSKYVDVKYGWVPNEKPTKLPYHKVISAKCELFKQRSE